MSNLLAVVALLIVAYLTGSTSERRHYRRIIEREKQLNNLPAVASRVVPNELFSHHLVVGEVTLAVDYFKRFLAAMHMFFGGEVTSYESLLDRARREALLRAKEQANAIGAELLLNVRYETSSVSRGVGGSLSTVEVLVYGTAMVRGDQL